MFPCAAGFAICSIRSPFSLTLTLATLAGRAAQAEMNWPRWGGADGSSHSSETGLPLSWSDEDVVWKTALEGFGQSMPCIWGDRIFLTTALDDGRQRVVFAVDRKTGRVLWKQVAWTGDPESSHGMNGHASATCATNGKVVVAFFGRGGLHAYSLDGERLWSRDLGQFDGPWGTAASPIFYGDTVVQNCDSESPEASLLAVDYRTGETVWNTPREVIRGWSTPIVIKTRRSAGADSQRPFAGVRGYDPQTGSELWSVARASTAAASPCPPYAHGRLYVVNGLAGDIYCVRPGGDGDVTATHRVWHTPRRAGRDLPSPVVIGNYLLACSMPGILFCYDCATRQGTVEGADRTEIQHPRRWWPKAAPTFTAKRADTIVVEPGEKINIVAKSKLSSETDELFRASIVPCQGQLFIRSNKFLYCIGQAASTK